MRSSHQTIKGPPMNRLRIFVLSATGAALGAVCVAAALSAEQSGRATGDANRLAAAESRVTTEVARDRAKVMHDVYAATLEMMHDRYFHGDRAAVPARAMQDVFAEMKRQSKVEARWISVNTKAMSIDHEPKSDFEKRAAREIAAGRSEVEVVEDGYLRRAAPIPLTGGCISCHEGFFKEPSKAAKFAGLVISVPVVSQ